MTTSLRGFTMRATFPAVLFLLSVILFPAPSFAEAYLKDISPSAADDYTKKLHDWAFHFGTHLRTSYNLLGNTVDLDRNKGADEVQYLGYVYDFTIDIRHISGVEVYGFIERRGRADYDSPLWGSRSIETIFGQYHYYRYTDMFPRVRELWAEIPLNRTRSYTLKVGLFPYGREIGNRMVMGGKYENYGFTLARKGERVDWNLHWEAEDINNRIHLGKVIDFDKVNRYNDTDAFFQAADLNLKFGKNLEHRFQPYIGWLADWTSTPNRANAFTKVVDSEALITPGLYLNLNFGRFSFGFEAARNFGAGFSSTGDVKHEGYLYISDVSVNLGSFKPKFKWLVTSGNRLDETNFASPTLPGKKNRAFSVFSPNNKNLTDSHYPKQFGPFVAMAGGYAANFGVQRPGTFGDPFLFENLYAYTTGFDFTPYDKIYVGIDYWYLRSKEAGFGRNDLGQISKFPKDLGNEIDFFISYELTKHIKLSVLSGYFIPGRYYKQRRGDNSSTNIFAPTPRRDGKADVAYQLEAGLDISF